MYTTLGPEQEYFLIDRGFFALRPDLVMSGRTLLGAAPSRGQQLEDHYFAGIPERIQACIAEVEHELYKLGVPIVTRHNEVAPSQFEMAPMFEETDLAVDHNQLVMATLRKVALRHGLQALLHEKPFAGINGSGKHCNWSMSITSDRPELDGFNLLKPGDTPHQNVRFLLFLAAVLQGVHRARGAAARRHRVVGQRTSPRRQRGAARDHQHFHGAHAHPRHREHRRRQDRRERRPGHDQARRRQAARHREGQHRPQPHVAIRVHGEQVRIPRRGVVGSPSHSRSCLLNAAVAESLGELSAALRAELKKTRKVDDAVLKVVRPVFKATRNVRFEGNNYSEEWIQEAERRGLPNIRRTPEALAQLTTRQSRDLLTGLGIFTRQELESRFHVRLERYVKDMLIEAHTLRELVDTMVLPAGYGYAGSLARAAAEAKAAGITAGPQVAAGNEVAKRLAAVQKQRAALDAAIAKGESMHGTLEAQARFLTGTCAESMHALRDACDGLELAIGDQAWPLPKYREMLFPV